MELLLAGLVNGAVGLLIGWSGIAGFLLPMFYVSALGLGTTEALTLSFAAFAVSGAIGAYNYKKSGSLPLAAAMPLCAGSLLGAVLGVALNALIPAQTVKLLLYLVVLGSGISILVRMRGEGKSGPAGQKPGLLSNRWVCAALGFVTAVICALSGAGGPVLVMPLLVVLGMDVRAAIGVALLDSVFIAAPSIVGYGLRCDITALLPLLAVGCLCHGAGVLLGSKSAHFIKQRPLKLFVAIFSILIAVYMVGSMWL